MRPAEYYLTHPSEIDLSNCNNIPDAPRVAGATSSAETTSKREGRSTTAAATGAEKGAKKTKSKSKKSKSGERSGAASDAAKVDKAVYTMVGKKISTEQIVKWIKAGDISKLEYATLLGKGKFIMGKPSWNDEARNFIKNVPKLMVRKNFRLNFWYVFTFYSFCDKKN